MQIHRQTRRVVWKFALSRTAPTSIQVSRFAPVVLVGLDPASGDPAIWLEVDPDAETVERQFVIYGTGHGIAGDAGHPHDIHVGSLIEPPFVWHVYERRYG